MLVTLHYGYEFGECTFMILFWDSVGVSFIGSFVGPAQHCLTFTIKMTHDFII